MSKQPGNDNEHVNNHRISVFHFNMHRVLLKCLRILMNSNFWLNLLLLSRKSSTRCGFTESSYIVGNLVIEAALLFSLCNHIIIVGTKKKFQILFTFKQLSTLC